MTFSMTHTCLSLPNEALRKSLQLRREKPSPRRDLTWALLTSLPHVAKLHAFPRGKELVYYCNGCHGSQCFRVTVLLSPDITPLIHVPDLQSRACQIDGNILELQTNHRRPALPCSPSPRGFFPALPREVVRSGTSRVRP